MCGAATDGGDELCERCDMEIFWSSVGRVNYWETVQAEMHNLMQYEENNPPKILTCPDCDVKYVDSPPGRMCPTCNPNRKRWTR